MVCHPKTWNEHISFHVKLQQAEDFFFARLRSCVWRAHAVELQQLPIALPRILPFTCLCHDCGVERETVTSAPLGSSWHITRSMLFTCKQTRRRNLQKNLHQVLVPKWQVAVWPYPNTSPTESVRPWTTFETPCHGSQKKASKPSSGTTGFSSRDLFCPHHLVPSSCDRTLPPSPAKV